MYKTEEEINKEFDEEFDEEFFDLHYRFCEIEDKKRTEVCKKQRDDVVNKIKARIHRIRMEDRESMRKKVDIFITNWLNDFANKPLEKRENAFNEVAQLRKDIIKLYENRK